MKLVVLIPGSFTFHLTIRRLLKMCGRFPVYHIGENPK